MKEHWKQVADELAALLVALKDHPHDLDMEAFAKGFTRAARAYLAAVHAEGLTSSRLRAVVKALDLKTKRSELEAFLGE